MRRGEIILRTVKHNSVESKSFILNTQFRWALCRTAITSHLERRNDT
jgi:hypothetical protein